jgi:DNA polymerase-3 subunit gamma/tau
MIEWLPKPSEEDQVNKPHELQRKHRPKTFDEVVGQRTVIRHIKRMLESGTLPHCILLHGPSGVGKTSTARIIAAELGTKYPTEFNCAEANGMETVAWIRQTKRLFPIDGKARVYILDEFDALASRNPHVQKALHKHLEDIPDRAWFILCASDLSKVSEAIISRTSTLEMSRIREKTMLRLLNDVLQREDKKVPRPLLDRIIAAADGDARKALRLLNVIVDLRDEDAMIEMLRISTVLPSAKRKPRR